MLPFLACSSPRFGLFLGDITRLSRFSPQLLHTDVAVMHGFSPLIHVWAASYDAPVVEIAAACQWYRCCHQKRSARRVSKSQNSLGGIWAQCRRCSPMRGGGVAPSVHSQAPTEVIGPTYTQGQKTTSPKMISPVELQAVGVARAHANREGGVPPSPSP